MENTIKDRYNDGYPPSFWFGSVLLSTFLILIASLLINRENVGVGSFIETYFTILLLALMFSTPSFLIIYLLYWILKERSFQPLTTKVILISMSVFAVIITFTWIGFDPFDNSDVHWVLAYVIGTIISGVFFNIEHKTSLRFSKTDSAEMPGNQQLN